MTVAEQRTCGDCRDCNTPLEDFLQSVDIVRKHLAGAGIAGKVFVASVESHMESQTEKTWKHGIEKRGEH